MSTGLPLFDAVSHARTTDPKTSKAAAARAGSFAHGHCQRILEALKAHGPMGKTRLSKATGIDHVAVCRRLNDLRGQGQAVPTGDTEKSASNRDEQVWRAL